MWSKSSLGGSAAQGPAWSRAVRVLQTSRPRSGPLVVAGLGESRRGGGKRKRRGEKEKIRVGPGQGDLSS